MARDNPLATLVGGELARMGARSATIYSILKSPRLCGRKMTNALARQVYLDATGKSSHSGLLPSSTSWYFDGSRRIMHASFILAMAWAWRSLGPEEAFIRSYAVYWRMTGGQHGADKDGAREIPADRAWKLVQDSLLPMQNWVEAKSKGHTAATPVIRLLRCKSCSVPIIASNSMLSVTCPVCRKKQDKKQD